MTKFDMARAKQNMDQNSDGMCDVCGMAVEDCIKSGQIECNMGDGDIGILGSQHIHANFRIVAKDVVLDLARYSHRHEENDDGLTSSFIHVHEANPTQLHMHATSVPLSLFFESIGLSFDRNCLVTDTKRYCADDQHSLSLLVNGMKSELYEKYVFADGDDIEIRYG